MSGEDAGSLESETPILRHVAREREFEPAIGDENAMQAITDHVEKHLGPIATVYHELISDLVHIDVHEIKPTSKRNFWTLFTTGMSDRPMTVPEGADDARYAELMICLPPSWKLSDEAFKDEVNYWPVGILKMLARLPHEYQTWLAPGHTIPNGDPAEPYVPGTEFCCALIGSPLHAPLGFDRVEVAPDKVVQFLTLIPIHREEMELKLAKGSDELFKKLDKQGVTELLKPGRKNVAKKSRWPF